jgi:hypothetical protein
MDFFVVEYRKEIKGSHTRKSRLRLQMHRLVSVWGRKFASVALIFNSLLTITCAVGLLYGLYAEHWVIYAPYLPSGAFYWLVIAAAILNIFPAATVGRVHTGRLWFHHYVYGFLVLFCAAAWIIFFTSVSILTVFLINTTNLSVNVGRFFMLGGLTLVLDDLPDVHTVAFRGLRWMKSKAHSARKVLDASQIVLGFFTLYMFVTVSLSVATNPQWMTVANFMQASTLLITALTSLASVERRVWHKIRIETGTHHLPSAH